MLKLIEQSRRPLTNRTKDAIHLLTGIDPLSWNKKKLKSTLGHPFNLGSYKWWQMVCQDENEAAPKRVLNDRVKALELIGKLMQKEQKGVLWEHEFRQFILKNGPALPSRQIFGRSKTRNRAKWCKVARRSFCCT